MKKKRFLGLFLSLALVLGMLPGMSLTAYAASYDSLTVGTVLHVGDSINSSTDYHPASGVSFNPNVRPFTLVRADIVAPGRPGYDLRISESETGAYYLFKYNGRYFCHSDPEGGISGLGAYVFEATATSDGIYVTSVNGSNVTFAVHEAPAHTHSFTYSASGATITASCDGTGDCDIKEGLTLSVSAPTGKLVYDGTTTYPAALSTGYNTTAFSGNYSISYTKDGSAYNGDPKDAGIYTASVTAGEGDAAKTASVSYTIAKADSTPATVIANNCTCDGTEKPLVTVTGKATGGTMQYALGKDATTAPTSGWTTSIPTGTDAGTYYVWYKAVGNDNYLDSKAGCVTAKIAAKDEDTNKDDTNSDDVVVSKPEYKNVSGAGSTWTAGSTEVPTFTFKRSENDETTYNHCTGVKVDEKAVDASYYTKEKGSVIIKLKTSFLDTLSVGEHTLTAMFDDGDDVTVKFTVAAKAEEKKADVETKTTEAKTTETKKAESPKTGDSTNVPLAFMLMLDSAMAAIYLTLRRCKKK